jgi:hypothetical protein
VGRLDSDKVRDASGSIIGYVQGGGIVYDRSLHNMGKIGNYGMVYDSHLKLIGRAKGLEPTVIAALYFFDLTPTLSKGRGEKDD